MKKCTLIFAVLALLACCGCHAHNIETVHSKADNISAHHDNIRNTVKSVTAHVSAAMADPTLLPATRAELAAAAKDLPTIAKDADQADVDLKGILDAADAEHIAYVKLQHSWGVRLMHWVDTLFWVFVGFGVLTLAIQLIPGGAPIIATIVGFIGHPLALLFTAGIPHLVHGFIMAFRALEAHVHTTTPIAQAAAPQVIAAPPIIVQ
jgi:membrane-bound ClpP family serine protease